MATKEEKISMGMKYYHHDRIIFNLPKLKGGNIARCIPIKKSCLWAAGRRAACWPPHQLLIFGDAEAHGRRDTTAPMEGTAKST